MNTKLTDTQQAVYEALGEASMAWTPIPSGVFESTRCKEIGDRLIEALTRHAKPTPTEDGHGDNAAFIRLSELNYILGLATSEHEKRWAAGVERMAYEKSSRPAPCPKGEKEPLEDADSPTICYACDTSNGKSDEWCAKYCHDESEQFCILKSRLSAASRTFLERLENKGETK